jgi:hypothetical protein
MSSPVPTLIICACYIYFVKSLGPRLMRDRKPFELRSAIIIYNVIQVVASIYLVYKVTMRTSIIFDHFFVTRRKFHLIFLPFFFSLFLSFSASSVNSGSGTRVALPLQSPLPTGRLFRRSRRADCCPNVLVVLLLQIYRVSGYGFLRPAEKV